MADDADLANDYLDIELSRVLKMRQSMGPKLGPKICKDCGENIPEPRRKLGFSLCIECAEESERRNAQFAS